MAFSVCEDCQCIDLLEMYGFLMQYDCTIAHCLLDLYICTMNWCLSSALDIFAWQEVIEMISSLIVGMASICGSMMRLFLFNYTVFNLYVVLLPGLVYRLLMGTEELSQALCSGKAHSSLCLPHWTAQLSCGVWMNELTWTLYSDTKVRYLHLTVFGRNAFCLLGVIELYVFGRCTTLLCILYIADRVQLGNIRFSLELFWIISF